MTVEVESSPSPDAEPTRADAPGGTDVRRRISRFEVVTAALVAVVLAGLVLIEPEVIEAPFENTRTVVFTFGGAMVAAAVFLVMLRFRVPALARVVIVGVPFVAVTYWLVEPFFVDDKVDDEFVTSIEDASSQPDLGPEPGGPQDTTAPTKPSAPAEPTLLGSGTFRGLAGHDGTGDAGFFALPDGSRVLRLESFDIQNGPDLRLYVVPGGDQTDPSDDSLYLGELRGNVGNQTYDIPPEFSLPTGDWTVLVWCEAFSVEFVAATVTVT